VRTKEVELVGENMLREDGEPPESNGMGLILQELDVCRCRRSATCSFVAITLSLDTACDVSDLQRKALVSLGDFYQCAHFCVILPSIASTGRRKRF
jgi:hypothetical protein